MGKRKYIPETHDIIPEKRWTVQAVDNAKTAYHGFLKWLMIGEKVAGGKDIHITIDGIVVDQDSTDFRRTIRFQTWDVAIKNADYWLSKVNNYIVVPDAELTRLRRVKYDFETMKHS